MEINDMLKRVTSNGDKKPIMKGIACYDTDLFRQFKIICVKEDIPIGNVFHNFLESFVIEYNGKRDV